MLHDIGAYMGGAKLYPNPIRFFRFLKMCKTRTSDSEAELQIRTGCMGVGWGV